MPGTGLDAFTYFARQESLARFDTWRVRGSKTHINLPHIPQTIRGRAGTQCFSPDSKSGKVSFLVTSSVIVFAGNTTYTTLLPPRRTPLLSVPWDRLFLAHLLFLAYPWMQTHDPMWIPQWSPVARFPNLLPGRYGRPGLERWGSVTKPSLEVSKTLVRGGSPVVHSKKHVASGLPLLTSLKQQASYSLS